MLLSFIVAGCQAPGSGQEDPVVEPTEPGEHVVAGPARDLQLIARTAVLGFRAEDGALRAGYATHDVSVRDGVAELIPHHVQATGERVTGGAIALETGAITRDDGTVVGGAAVARTDAQGAVEIARGAAVEVLTNREDGVQQEWRFAAAPEGTGDLTVEVRVTGQRFVAATDSGLHFQSSAGLGFRYSHALWLDSAGHEWPIQAVWKGDRIAITVPGDILAESTFPAVLDPTITAEVAVDQQVNGATGANSLFPAVAFDGTNYLVVWSDQRISRDDDIFGALVSQTGAVLSTNGITINTAAGSQRSPTVAFAGTQYVVAWEDAGDISAARVSTTGTVIQLGKVAPSGANEIDPDLAGNGNGALLVWDNGGNIRASLFNGTVFGGAISVTADALVQSTPAVAAAPAGNYLVAYSEGAAATADLRGAFVSTAGVLSGAPFTISAGAGRQFDPSAAFDGTSYVVVWTNNSAGINLFGARVSTAGAVLDTRTEGATPNVGGVSISSAAGNQELASLVCKLGACAVAWQDSRNLALTSFDIRAQRLATGAALANDGPEVILSQANRAQFVPAISTNNTDFIAVWQDSRDANADTIFAARLTAAGEVSDPAGIPLVRGNNRETAPAMGRAGSTFGVFWTDSRSFGTDIELVRFSGGTKLDATARAVSSATFAQSSPAATMSNGNFFVVWQDSRGGIDRDIFGARVSSAGAVLDPAGTAIAVATGDQLVPEIATNGTVSLVVWQDRRTGQNDILAAVVDNATGAVILGDIVICDVAGNQDRPAVAFDAGTNQFLVVWTDSRINTDPNVFGARVTAIGDVVDPDGVLISGAANGQFKPRVTFLNSLALVAWEDRRNDTQGDIFGARVTVGPVLSVVDPAGFSISGTAAGSQTHVAVSSLSGSFLVAWTDGRDINATGTDIFGQQVGISGTLNGAAFAISTDRANEDGPVLSDAATNVTRIAYTRERADLQTIRVQSRAIGVSAGTGQACSNDGQCSTGFCVDSRCCDSACGGNNRTDCQACRASLTGGADGTCTLIPATSICRNYADTFCDLRELCTGTSSECPADIGRNEGQVCDSTTGAVCPANGAPGPHGCP
jgi:hypothetical protein